MLICISAPTIVLTIYMDENICSNREGEDDGDDDDGGEVDINNELTAIIPPAMTIAKLATNSTSFGQAHDAAKWAYNGMRVSTSNLEDSLMANRDESSLPVYMAYFQNIMELEGIDKSPSSVLSSG